MSLVTVLNLLLFYESGQEDFVIGSLIAGRDHEQLAGLIGFFVNTLPLRIGVRPEETLGEVLRRAARVTVAAHEHQHLPFNELVDSLQLPRLLNSSPLFQVLAVYQAQQQAPQASPSSSPTLATTTTTTTTTTTSPPWPSQAVPSRSVFVQYEMVWEFVERGEELEIVLSYMTELYDAATAQRLLATFNLVAERLMADPGQPVLALEPSERVPTLPPLRLSPLLPDLHRLCVQQPRLLALSYREQLLSYGELWAAVEHLAAVLAGAGVQPGARVLVCLPRQPLLVAALLAVWRLGATYVPVEHGQPSARLAFIAKDSGAVLSLGTALPHLPSLLPSDLSSAFSQPATSQPLTLPALPDLAPSSLAYIIYTSGSTGTPKGVEVRHSGLANVVEYYRQQVDFSRTPLITSVSFDISELELWSTLLSGGCIRIIEASTARDGFALAEELGRFQPTAVQATPATWRLLREAGWSGLQTTALVGGETLAAELAAWLCSQSRAVLHNYGPTEATVWALAQWLRPGRRVRLGHALPGLTCCVLDPSGQPCRPGTAGELLLGGVGLAAGYCGRPDQTAAKFVSVNGQAWYRTGDLAKRLPNGELEFIGRADFQVKIQV